MVADPTYSQVRDNLLGMAVPHRGPTVVFAGDAESALAHLHIDSEGSAHLEPLGLDFHAASIPESTAAQVQHLFDPNRQEEELDASAAVRHADAKVINLATLANFAPQLSLPTNGHTTNGHSNPAMPEQVRKPRTFPSAVPSMGIGPNDGDTSNGDELALDLGLNPMSDRNSDNNNTDAASADADSEAGIDAAATIDLEPVVDIEAESEADPEAKLESDDEPVRSDNGLVGPELLVRVLGVPGIPDRPELKRRQLILAVYLASRGGSSTVSGVQDAIWNGKAVQDKTLWNLVSRTRSSLGVLANGDLVMPQADRQSNSLRLAGGVRTDLDVFRDRYELALTSSPVTAIALLARALDLIEGPPFDAAGYDWVHHTHQLVAEASDLIERATELLVTLTSEQGDVETARHALVQGLRGLPGNEVLYRLRMTLEHDTGNLAAVKGAYVELLGFLGDLEADPSDATVELYEQFTRTATVFGRNT